MNIITKIKYISPMSGTNPYEYLIGKTIPMFFHNPLGNPKIFDIGDLKIEHVQFKDPENITSALILSVKIINIYDDFLNKPLQIMGIINSDTLLTTNPDAIYCT